MSLREERSEDPVRWKRMPKESLPLSAAGYKPLYEGSIVELLNASPRQCTTNSWQSSQLHHHDRVPGNRPKDRRGRAARSSQGTIRGPIDRSARKRFDGTVRTRVL